MSGRQEITFSVIIPVYNGEETLSRAIDSVLAQAYPALEIIVIDDGSTDNTAAIAAKYANDIRYIHQSNRGVAHARNFAASQAEGEWLAFLDADDWYYADRLSMHAEWLATNPKLDMLSGNFDYVAEGRQTKRENFLQSELGKSLKTRADKLGRVCITPQDLTDYVSRHVGDTHTLTVRKAVFESVGGYPEHLRVCEDVHLLIRLLDRCEHIGVTVVPMAAYCVHSQSATRINPVESQRQTVQAMSELSKCLSPAKQEVKLGIEKALGLAKLDLCYALIRQQQYLEAISVQVREALRKPSVRSFKDVASILKGVCLRHG